MVHRSHAVSKRGRSKSEAVGFAVEDEQRSLRVPSDGSQRRGKAHSPRAAGRAKGSSWHTSSPCPAFHLPLPARADCTKTHTALGALAGMGWAGAARTKEPGTPHHVGRAAHLAPGTHHLFRAASSAQGCGLGTDKSTLWQRRLYINCYFNCQSAL